MIRALKQRIFGGPSEWMYSDECQMIGCSEQQQGLDGAKVEYCADCAEYTDKLAGLKVDVMDGEIAGYHDARCPNQCTSPRPRLVPESWGQDPPESVSCPECGTECVIVEQMTHDEIKTHE